MEKLTTTYDYLKTYAADLDERILETYKPLHGTDDPIAPEMRTLKRAPFPAQEIGIMGAVKYLQAAGDTNIVAECGAGKTLIALGIAQVHAHAKPWSMIVMCPPHLVKKWAREAIMTIPGVRCFFIEDLRNDGALNLPYGVNEVRLVGDLIKRTGYSTSLPKLRAIGRKGWRKVCSGPCVFIMGKEKAKLGYYWKHVYQLAKSGENKGGLVNPDSGMPVASPDGGFRTSLDFSKVKLSEVLEGDKGGTSRFSPLWTADGSKLQRMAPIDFMGRYMKGFFDYAVADEVHQLANETAQGQGLAVLRSIAAKLIKLTGTWTGGYADDSFQIMYRSNGTKMVEQGYEYSSSGRMDFQRKYGVIETIEKIENEDNACSKAKKSSVRPYRRPGISPLLFGRFLMENTVFLSLEDLYDELPPYEEFVVQIPLAGTLKSAYEDIEEKFRSALRENPKHKGLRSLMLQTLLCYPDHPFGFKKISYKVFNKQTHEMEIHTLGTPKALPETNLFPKEERLIEDVRANLSEGRRCQVFATFTHEHDVVARLESVLRNAGFRVAVLRPTVPTEKREEWYAKRLQEGVEVVICHPKLVETGLDLLAFPSLMFFETGYSLHTLRQASRRSWRIGQEDDVKVYFYIYEKTRQESCIRLMGKKMLVALMTEGKFSGEGLQGLDDEEDDLVGAMVRELVERNHVGESADKIWRDLDRQRSACFQKAPKAPKPTRSAPIVEESTFTTTIGIGLIRGVQLSLFD